MGAARAWRDDAPVGGLSSRAKAFALPQTRGSPPALTRPCPPLRPQLYGGIFTEEAGYGPPPLTPEPRYHFDYFVPGMLTSFVLMTGAWLDAAEAHVEVGRATAPPSRTDPTPIPLQPHG